MTIAQTEHELIERLNKMPDWSFQFEYVLMEAVHLPELSESERMQAGLVSGCQAKVWILVSGSQECIEIKGDSGSLLVKGLLALLVKILNGHSSEEINDYSIHYLNETKLGENLSQDRQVGVQSMLEHIKAQIIYLEKRK